MEADYLALKQMIEEVFQGLKEKNKEMYDSLEKKVKEEVCHTAHDYQIYCGVIKSQYYKAQIADLSFFPILQEDLIKRQHQAIQIMETLKAHEFYALEKVMVKMDYLKIKDLQKHQHVFEGTLVTNVGDYHMQVVLKPAKRYMEQVANLYELFIANMIPWHTVNVAYLNKMMVVSIANVEEMPEEAIIEKIQIDFKEYQPFIVHDVIPVWNIKSIELMTKGFPEACEDHLHFVHDVRLTEYEQQNGFLIASHLEDIGYIDFFRDHLAIICQIQDPIWWQVKMIMQPKATPFIEESMPLLSNQKMEMFIEKYHLVGQKILTLAEIKRMIYAFNFGMYLKFETLELLPAFEEDDHETYNMNDFIQDEIRQVAPSHKLMLTFSTPDKHLFFVRDLMSFIVSELQQLYPEYECKGRLL